MVNKIALIPILIVGIISINTTLRADTLTLSTVADFQQADISNGMITLTNDGEITQNYYFDPDVITSTSTLPKSLCNHAACTFADVVVVVGGFDASSYSDAVYLNTIQGSGLGSWRNGPSLPVAVRDHKIAKNGNYIYCFGGQTAGGLQGNVYRAAIDYNAKTLGTWQNAGTMPTLLEKYALITHLNQIYLIGGTNGTPSDQVYMCDLDINGNLTNWQLLTPLPKNLSDLNAAEYGGSIWVVGGNNGSNDVQDVYVATIQGDGQISNWAAKGNYPLPISRHGLVSTSAGLIVLGGVSNSVYQANAYYSSIRDSNTLNAWTFKMLPGALADQAAVIYKDQLIYIGGRDNTMVLSDARRVTLKDYKPWKGTSVLIASIRFDEIVEGIHDFVYFTGGQNGSMEIVDEVYKSTLQPTGGCGPWSIGGYLPVSIIAHSAMGYNNRMYISGGRIEGLNNTNVVYYSNAISSGTGDITNWSWATPLPHTMVDHESIAHNGYIYIFEDASVYMNSVNTDGSLGNTWTQTAGLPAPAGEINPVVLNNRMYIFLQTTPVRVVFSEIGAGGILGSWSETTQLSSTFSYEGGAFVADTALVCIDRYSHIARAIINPDGTVNRWERMDDVSENDRDYFAAYHIGGVYYSGRYNINTANSYQNYLTPFRYCTQVILPIITFNSIANIQNVIWQSSYPSYEVQFWYRTFNQTWSPRTIVDGTTLTMPVNQNALGIQIGYFIQSQRKKVSDVSSVQVNYINLDTTPTPVVLPEGFDGQVISKKYTYVYPNPSRGHLARFNIYAAEPANASLKIFTTTNRLVYSTDNRSLSLGNNEITWNCSDIANGVYFYKVTAKGDRTGAEETILKKIAIIK